MDTSAAREITVERHIRARGVRDPRVLAAMFAVQREAFLPPELADVAYDDRPLPIEAGQTISQPYIVAAMTEALALRPGQTVLEIGTGSGYAAAVLAEIASHVYTVERHADLIGRASASIASTPTSTCTLGWNEHAPYDAIIVAAGGPELPPALLDQLKVGGRLVMPVGSGRAQNLVRVTRATETDYQHEDLGAVQFVPLIGAQGWAEPAATSARETLPRRPPGPLTPPSSASRSSSVAKLISECAEPIGRIDDHPLDALLGRIADARVVLLGEATHETSEFYRMRTRITQELIRHDDLSIRESLAALLALRLQC